MFKDKVKIQLKAGDGGYGHASFDRHQKPNGGFGGDGGNVYLRGTTHLYDLAPFMNSNEYSAEDGGRGGKNNRQGEDGKDITLKVPVATIIYDENKNKILEVTKNNEKILLLKGGIGGVGNFYYRGKGAHKREKSKPGESGQELNAILELELVSDIIFIGLPNAGKSSILKETTNAEAKVAPYAFTTIDPQLGRTKSEITLMDLPGLIEDTVEGKGVGTKFVKHTRRSKAIAHFLSLESEDIIADYELIRNEIKEISDFDKESMKRLDKKPEIIVLTKSDLVDKKIIEERKSQIEKFNENIVITSAYDLESLENLEKRFGEFLENI